jgi:hypothetical protein
MTCIKGVGMKAQKKPSANNSRFRPGSGGACEAQLWIFTGPQAISEDDHTPEAVRVAAESLDAALQYVRQRHGDFIITAARLAGMVAVVSGSPLD